MTDFEVATVLYKEAREHYEILQGLYDLGDPTVSRADVYEAKRAMKEAYQLKMCALHDKWKTA